MFFSDHVESEDSLATGSMMTDSQSLDPDLNHKPDSPSTEESSGFEDMLSVGQSQQQDKVKVRKPEDVKQMPKKLDTNHKGLKKPGFTSGLPSSNISRPGVSSIKAPVTSSNRRTEPKPVVKSQVLNKENVGSRFTPSARPSSAPATKYSAKLEPQSVVPVAEKAAVPSSSVPKPTSKPSSQSKLPTFNTRPSKLRPPTVRNH